MDSRPWLGCSLREGFYADTLHAHDLCLYYYLCIFVTFSQVVFTFLLLKATSIVVRLHKNVHQTKHSRDYYRIPVNCIDRNSLVNLWFQIKITLSGGKIERPSRYSIRIEVNNRYRNPGFVQGRVRHRYIKITGFWQNIMWVSVFTM